MRNRMRFIAQTTLVVWLLRWADTAAPTNACAGPEGCEPS